MTLPPGPRASRRDDRRLGVPGMLLAGLAAAVVLGGGVGAYIAGRKIKHATDGKPLSSNSITAPSPYVLAPAAKDTLPADAGPTATLRLDMPRAHELFLGGRSAGYGPRILTLPAGEHALEVRHDGQVIQRRVRLSAGAIHTEKF